MSDQTWAEQMRDHESRFHEEELTERWERTSDPLSELLLCPFCRQTSTLVRGTEEKPLHHYVCPQCGPYRYQYPVGMIARSTTGRSNRSQKAREERSRNNEESLERMSVEPWMKQLDFPILRRLYRYADISSLDQMRGADPSKIEMFGPKAIKHVEDVARRVGVLGPDEHLFRPWNGGGTSLERLEEIRQYANSLKPIGPLKKVIARSDPNKTASGKPEETLECGHVVQVRWFNSNRRCPYCGKPAKVAAMLLELVKEVERLRAELEGARRAAGGGEE